MDKTSQHKNQTMSWKGFSFLTGTDRSVLKQCFLKLKMKCIIPEKQGAGAWFSVCLTILERILSLNSCSDETQPSFIYLAEAEIFWFKISWHFLESIIPCMQRVQPGPLEEKQPCFLVDLETGWPSRSIKMKVQYSNCESSSCGGWQISLHSVPGWTVLISEPLNDCCWYRYFQSAGYFIVLIAQFVQVCTFMPYCNGILLKNGDRRLKDLDPVPSNV